MFEIIKDENNHFGSIKKDGKNIKCIFNKIYIPFKVEKYYNKNYIKLEIEEQHIDILMNILEIEDHLENVYNCNIKSVLINREEQGYMPLLRVVLDNNNTPCNIRNKNMYLTAHELGSNIYVNATCYITGFWVKDGNIGINLYCSLLDIIE